MALSTRADSARSVASGFSISIGTPRSIAARIGSTCRCSSVAMMAQVTSGRLNSSRWLWVTKSAPIFGTTSPARFGFFSASPIHFTAGWRFATSPRNSPTRPPPMIARPMSLDGVLMARSLVWSCRELDACDCALSACGRGLPQLLRRLERVRGTPHAFEIVDMSELPSPARGEGATAASLGGLSYVVPGAEFRLEICDRRDGLVGERQVDRLVAVGGEVGGGVGLHYGARALGRDHDRRIAD